MSNEHGIGSHSRPGAPSSYDVIIIGAGFSGLYMMHRARDILGLNVIAFEAGGDVGGTWFWNRYPGARCDSESWYYCYSFSEDLYRDWQWSSRYPDQPEILSYLRHVAARFDLRRDIEFDTRVLSAHFDEGSARWTVTTDDGRQTSCAYLISAVGCLSSANVPSIPGLERFMGEWYHTGNWPHEGVSFASKRVGLIGTGSTGIQATPVIAAQADSLTVFQRTPNYSVPARNAALASGRLAQIKDDYKDTWNRARNSFGGFPYQPSERSALDCAPDERERIYEQLWEHGGFKFLFGSFYDIILNEEANRTAADFIRRKIRETVNDQAVAESLCPYDYPYGAKRPPIDTDYYATFNRDNVKLVDLRSDPLIEITPTGIRTKSEHYQFDMIVFATGFDAMTGSLARIDLRGRDGVTLAERWADGPRTYLGLQVAGFPNFFTITGPQSPSVLSNMPVSIEQHVEWISDCIAHLRFSEKRTIEATAEAEEEWVRHTSELADLTLFSKAASWYLGANIPGKKRVFMPYVGGVQGYRERCDAVAADGYAGFCLS